MSIPTRVTAAAFFVFALVSTTQGHVQAPVQVSTQAQALPADDDFNALRGPAAAGDAQAQFALGNDYIDGREVAQDYGQAVIWYRKSAAQGYAPALNQLGYMQENKIGLPRDYKRALYYYRLAAKKGNALAEYNLGAMYQSGLQVRRDYRQAFEWYRKAADQNLADAENEVGYFLPVRMGGQARLCSGFGLVSPRRQPRQLQRRNQSRLHGGERMGSTSKL